MAESAYQILMRIFPSYIKQDEKLISVGCFIKRAGYLKNQLTLGYARLWNQSFYVGLTNKRIIVLPIKRVGGKIDDENVFSIGYKDVEVKGNKLIINQSNIGRQLKLSFALGIKSISGLDKEEFISAIYRFQHTS